MQIVSSSIIKIYYLRVPNIFHALELGTAINYHSKAWLCNFCTQEKIYCYTFFGEFSGVTLFLDCLLMHLSSLLPSSLPFFLKCRFFLWKKQFAFCSFWVEPMSDLSSPSLGADSEALMLTSARPGQSFRVMCVQTERNKCARNTHQFMQMPNPSIIWRERALSKMSCGAQAGLTLAILQKTHTQICLLL